MPKILHIFFLSISCFFLFQSVCEAFGPVTHVTLGCEILGGLALLSPGLARLLKEYGNAFLYGNMAADVIVAKNLAAKDKHCHNWNVGFGVLEEARSDAQRAFAWGYLCHLAADVIAHNYFVPWKLVRGFSARSTGHAYWEIRLDQKAPGESWRLVNEISRQRFQEQNGLLSRTIEGTLFRFETNLTIFNGMLFVQRLKRWRALLNRVERRSKWSLQQSDVEEIYELALAAMYDLLLYQKDAKICLADPTGFENLKVAKELRKGLRRRLQRERGENAWQEQALLSIQRTFREGAIRPFERKRWTPEIMSLLAA